MADRDPDTIKQEIDQARDQLAATVDELAVRANPRRLADDLKAGLLEFVTKPPVAITIAGIGSVVLVLVVRRIRDR
ncbi:DUF3618 domain-containing protein [Mycolicibacterium grossiae]|uniref:DUF3618 domain-containing protein n=1 Tax=Mycolicibacterium grossiae TaxID=1552759 RepID=A0A1E8PYS4_9MYCO|nr:DUF3618 domain-containing protein [Mycolicibacterium grossiae]OFJ51321.1 hypothetical protein BEL07_23360 [Mycolicibacterium grossiae]QEM47420.1 DUF3618 domain-containing protein [Mycolicibacterium grossiae]